MPDRPGFVSLGVSRSGVEFDTAVVFLHTAPVKARIQSGRDGGVPQPPEKRFFIRSWLSWPAWARLTTTGCYWVLVNWFLFAPSTTFQSVHHFLPQQDKIAHLVMMGTLAALVRWSIPDRWGRGWNGAVVILVLAAYGFGTECIQALVPSQGRSFEWADVLMDGLGSLLGMWLCGRLVCPAGRSRCFR